MKTSNILIVIFISVAIWLYGKYLRAHYEAIKENLKTHLTKHLQQQKSRLQDTSQLLQRPQHSLPQ